MAIERDIPTRTAVSVDYTRTGNTLDRRERHGVKDINNVIIITFEEITHYEGQAGLDFLASLTGARDTNQEFLDQMTAQNDASEAELQSGITFQSEQIAEIEALL
jgi:hypothetical protein